MIGQCLSNINENVTISKFRRIFASKQGLSLFDILPPSFAYYVTTLVYFLVATLELYGSTFFNKSSRMYYT